MITDIKQIVKNYSKGSMVLDVTSTIPCLFLNMNSNWFLLRIIRFIHVREVINKVSDLFEYCLDFLGLDKAIEE